MHQYSTGLEDAYAHLKRSGRGKHVYPFSYYHADLVDAVPEAREALAAARTRLQIGTDTQFNVVKLDAGHRISFLLYEPFDAHFPVLLAADSCDLTRCTVRKVSYANRPNPPILHRKELLLPADHPLVPEATRLTERLEQRGAFVRTSTIGTRSGWKRRLTELGLAETGHPLT